MEKIFKINTILLKNSKTTNIINKNFYNISQKNLFQQTAKFSFCENSESKYIFNL